MQPEHLVAMSLTSRQRRSLRADFDERMFVSRSKEACIRLPNQGGPRIRVAPPETGGA